MSNNEHTIKMLDNLDLDDDARVLLDEADEILSDDLEAAIQVYNDLRDGTHYEKHERALHDMFGPAIDGVYRVLG